MAHTVEDLVTKQQAADRAHARVLELRDQYGSSAGEGWSEEQTAAFDEAWRAWRAAAEDVQAAVTGHAKDQGLSRYGVEADVKKAARHPEVGKVA